jgi:hypothetical protein
MVDCKGKTKEGNGSEVRVMTPVTVTSPEYKSISDLLTFRSISSYQKKNVVKATITGYIVRNFVSIGDLVSQGKILYTVQTKEAKALPDLLTVFTFLLNSVNIGKMYFHANLAIRL